MQCFSTLSDYARRANVSIATVNRRKERGQLAYLQLHRPFIPILAGTAGFTRDMSNRALTNVGVEEIVIEVAKRYPSVVDESDIRRIFGVKCPVAGREIVRALGLVPINEGRSREYLRLDLIVAISRVYEQQADR